MDATGHAPARPAATRRLAYVDTLRGLAALWVFLLHIHGYWLDNVRPPTLTADGLLVRVMGFGGAGVDIFIVLSGFCLTLPLLRGGSMHSLDARRFFRRRAYRLLPAYYAAVVLVMALELVPALQERLVARPLTGVDVITHLTLTFPLFSETLGSVNGSLWSISLEATLYLGFPLLLLIHRRWRMRGALLTTFAVALVWAVFTVWWLAQPHPLGFLPDPAKLFPARWFQFALGMWAATLVVAASPAPAFARARPLQPHRLARAARRDRGRGHRVCRRLGRRQRPGFRGHGRVPARGLRARAVPGLRAWTAAVADRARRHLLQLLPAAPAGAAAHLRHR